MWKHILQIFMIICMFVIVAYIYRLNMQQIDKKNKMIEKFKEHIESFDSNNEPKPYSNDDYVLYANIIGVFKTQLNREPTQDELFACFNKINKKEMSLSELNTLLVKEPTNYRLFLFPEAEKSLLSSEDSEDKTNSNSENNDTKDENDKDEEDDEDEEVYMTDKLSEKNKKLYDKDHKIQYIINRPTVYNIGGTTKGMNSTDSLPGDDIRETTKKILESVKNTKIEIEDIEDDGELVDKSDYLSFDQVENSKQNVRNRCQTAEEFEDQNRLATTRHSRNMNQIAYDCDRNKNKDKVAHDYDDMVLRHDQLWKMPERRPPLCNMNSKKKCNVNPIEVQSALIGTLLNDASDTSVGSILPKFQFKENKN